MADDVAIKVQHLSKDFVLPHEKVTSVKSAFTGMFKRNRTKESQHALKDISFEIKKGEFFGIVGRNGSGKSTMLKILAGIYQPTKGSVRTHGRLVPFIELGVGFNPELTGRENVFLNGAMLGFSRKETEAMYNDIVAFAELERFMDQKLKNYSSGMQVRLAFSMAIRSNADILLVDEVLAVGDADFQRKCFEYFRSLKRDKKTVVFVSHDMNAVQQFCDRALLIDKGKINSIGESHIIAEEYTKLFVKEVLTDSGTTGTRWGDHTIVFKNPEIKQLTNEGKIKITTHATTKEDVGALQFGFSVKDTTGKVILGTNNNILKQPVHQLKKDNGYRIEWEMDSILNSGTYTVDITVSHDGSISDWWGDALSFNVTNLKDTPYVVSPPVEFSIIDSHSADKI